MTPTQATRTITASPGEAGRAAAPGQGAGARAAPFRSRSRPHRRRGLRQKPAHSRRDLESLIREDRRFRLVLKVMDGEEFLEAARQPPLAWR